MHRSLGILVLLLAPAGLASDAGGVGEDVCVAATDVRLLPGATLVQGSGALSYPAPMSPRCVVIVDGSTVTWTNLDAVGHQILSDGCFRSGAGSPYAPVPPGGTFTARFERDGARMTVTTPEAEFACAAAVAGGLASVGYFLHPSRQAGGRVLVDVAG